MPHFSLPNLFPLETNLPASVAFNRKAVGTMLSDSIETVLTAEFDEAERHLKQHGYDTLCLPLFCRLARELVRGDQAAAEQSNQALQACTPDSELIAEFWMVLEATSLLVRGIWLRNEELAFHMGLLLAEMGKGSLAKRAYQATKTHPLFPISSLLSKGGVA